MRITRFATGFVAAAVGIGSLAACSSSSGDSGSGDSATIGVVLSDSSNPFFQVMSEGIKAKADELGIEVIERDAPKGTDTQAFNNNVDSVAAQGIDGLIVAPISASNLSAVKRVADKGIPVVQLDSPMEGFDQYLANFSTDNVAAGSMSMTLLLDKLKAEGKPLNVGIVNNTLGYQSVNDRTKGAQDTAEAAGATVKIVDGGASQADAQSAVETTLRGDSSLSGFLATVGSVYGLGANAAMRTANVAAGDVFITGVDGVSAEVDLIKAGPYYIGTAAQQPRLMGENGVQAIQDQLDGKTVEKDQTVPPEAVDTDNAATFEQ